MAFNFHLPDIGEGVIEGEIVEWKVSEGDRIELDQPMVEVMTDKATVEIPSPRAGTISKINFDAGQICPVGRTPLPNFNGLAAAWSMQFISDHAQPNSNRYSRCCLRDHHPMHAGEIFAPSEEETGGSNPRYHRPCTVSLS